MWTSAEAKARRGAAGVLLLAAAAGGAFAQDNSSSNSNNSSMEPAVVVQGFASAGYTRSSGNNFYGNSTRSGGDFDYRELGISGYAQLTPTISVAAQLISRRAGRTEDGSPSIDYGFVDLQWPQQDAGLRLGRVKNPLGFHNTTRDVLSTRPSILMPQSVYLEGTALREVVFSGDGVQAYKHWSSGAGETGVTANWLPRRRGSEQMRRNRLPENPGATRVELTIQPAHVLQLRHDLPSGEYQFALGYSDIPLGVTASYPAPLPVLSYGVESRAWLLSARRNGERFTLTTEWRLARDRLSSPGLPFPVNHTFQSRSGYVQADYRVDSRVTLFARWDRLQSLGISGADRVLGGSWRFARGWQANLEYHDMRGDNLVARVENPNPSSRTRLLAAMVGYRF